MILTDSRVQPEGVRGRRPVSPARATSRLNAGDYTVDSADLTIFDIIKDSGSSPTWYVLADVDHDPFRNDG